MAKKYYRLVAVWCCCWCLTASGQPSSPEIISFRGLPSGGPDHTNAFTPFVVGRIYVEGNKKTKPYVIERELPFKPGDSVYLPDLVKQFEVAREQLMNTTLFNEVVVALKSFRGYYVDVIIQVKERWYIFPVPYVKPVDRNLTEWAKQGYGVDRLNYGFKFMYNNFTGRNDKLRMWLITGYTRQIQFQYEQPYADKNLKNGYKINVEYSFNHEVNYQTHNNQQQFVDSLANGVKRWNVSLDYTYRPGLRTFHDFGIGYYHEEIDDRVLQLNPKYYGTPANSISYPEFVYSLGYYNVDYIPYSLHGWMGEFRFLKRGVSRDMNMWRLDAKVTKNWQLAKKTYFSGQVSGVLELPFDQPFINQRMFGYGDLYLRGLEGYVIDGVGGVLLRNTLRRELVHFRVPTGLKNTSHDYVPFRIYANIFADIGYDYNKTIRDNSLVNRLLCTAGPGVDVVTFYDFVFRLNYAFNQLGQSGFYFHIKSDF